MGHGAPGSSVGVADPLPTLHCPFTKLAPDLAYSVAYRYCWARGSFAGFNQDHAGHPMSAKPSRLPAKRILLAEDDDSMRGFLERALAKAGYEVIAFANGREAHERLKQEPFTLLLTDIVMPQMDGIELARRAAELDPELKIMFITGFAAVTLNTNNPMPRDARVLSKPFHLKDLVREIDRLLT
jgi:two-component system, cell cycle response regulator CpdR